MAVTLDTADLMLPVGELDEGWLPDGDMNALVSEAILQAKALVEAHPHIAAASHNQAAAAWVYGRAYRAVASRLAAQPSTATIGGQVTRIISADRVTYFQKLAEAKEAEFAAYALAPDALDLESRSQRTSVRAVW